MSKRKEKHGERGWKDRRGKVESEKHTIEMTKGENKEREDIQQVSSKKGAEGQPELKAIESISRG